MDTHLSPTKFLPAERSSPEEIARQRAIVGSIPFLSETLDSMTELAMILNEHRQILFANQQVIRALGKPLDALAGLRPGEAVGCIRACVEGGCGTSEHCTVCGAGRALQGILRGSPMEERDCRILVEAPRSDFDLQVRATSRSFGGLPFTIFVAQDRSGETRRRMLERLFFHDTLNTATALEGISDLLPETKGEDFSALCRLLRTSSEQIVDQLVSQRDLASVESGEYRLNPVNCRIAPFLRTVADLIAAHPVAAEHKIVVSAPAEDSEIVTDQGLLARVVENMLKNAVEAEPKGSTVRLGCDAGGNGGVAIWVRNPSYIPNNVKLQLFQRSFSTKGADRGLGTYSMRLLGERYLGGAISVRSDPEAGTEFRISLPRASPPPPPGPARA